VREAVGLPLYATYLVMPALVVQPPYIDRLPKDTFAGKPKLGKLGMYRSPCADTWTGAMNIVASSAIEMVVFLITCPS
jgi:hypothetical protein